MTSEDPTILSTYFETYSPWYRTVDALATATVEGWSGTGRRDALTGDGILVEVAQKWETRTRVGPSEWSIDYVPGMRASSARDGEDWLRSRFIELDGDEDQPAILAKIEALLGEVRAGRAAARPGVVAELMEAAQAVQVADRELAGRQEVRDRLIREALAAGVAAADVVAASGVSRARVYQIRDIKR